MATASVFSEVGRLRKVILHSPGREHDLVTPDQCDDLLLEDIFDNPKLRREHETFRNIFEAAGVEIFGIRDLFAEVLATPQVRRDFIAELCYLSGHRDQEENFRELDITSLVRLTVEGRDRLNDHQYFWPLPNLMFTRDIAAVVGNSTISSWAHYSARQRESLLTKYTLRHHPLFQHSTIIEAEEQCNHASPTIEGGDVVVADSKTVLIGSGERTSREAVEIIADKIFQEESFENVLMVALPKHRSTMHLDTIFTLVSENECLAFPPLVMPQGDEEKDLEVTLLSRNGQQQQKGLLQGLQEVGLLCKPLFCGGTDEEVQRREQWTDGANALALAPGKIISYKRNRATIDELKWRGYEPVTAEAFIKNAPELMDDDQNLVITLEGTELSRARGGPRCLSLPLVRDSVDPGH